MMLKMHITSLTLWNSQFQLIILHQWRPMLNNTVQEAGKETDRKTDSQSDKRPSGRHRAGTVFAGCTCLTEERYAIQVMEKVCDRAMGWKNNSLVLCSKAKSRGGRWWVGGGGVTLNAFHQQRHRWTALHLGCCWWRSLKMLLAPSRDTRATVSHSRVVGIICRAVRGLWRGGGGGVVGKSRRRLECGVGWRKCVSVVTKMHRLTQARKSWPANGCTSISPLAMHLLNFGVCNRTKFCFEYLDQVSVKILRQPRR